MTQCQNMELTHELAQAALTGLEYQRDNIARKIQLLQTALGSKPKRTTAAPKKAAAPAEEPQAQAARPNPRKKAQKKGKRNLSPEARVRIAEAQRKRWAAFRGEADA